MDDELAEQLRRIEQKLASLNAEMQALRRQLQASTKSVGHQFFDSLRIDDAIDAEAGSKHRQCPHN